MARDKITTAWWSIYKWSSFSNRISERILFFICAESWFRKLIMVLHDFLPFLLLSNFLFFTMSLSLLYNPFTQTHYATWSSSVSVDFTLYLQALNSPNDFTKWCVSEYASVSFSRKGIILVKNFFNVSLMSIFSVYSMVSKCWYKKILFASRMYGWCNG